MPEPTAPQPRIPTRAGYSQSNLFEVALFTLMVGAIATVVLVVMWEYSWLGGIFIGGAAGAVAGIVIALLLGRSKPTPEAKPVGHAPRASAGREGPVVPVGPDDRPNTTLQSRGLGGIPDAGGVGRPATPEARSPLDPAELPVAGAGGPLGAGASAREDDAGASDPSARKSASTGGDASGGAVPYDPANAPGGPIVKPAAARGAPESIAEPTVSGVEPVKPEMLDAPREGGPDDLTQIRGIGPALESMLHRMGVYHFDQIASWSPAEVAWADENLEDFRGRVTRDDWVGQARALRSS